MNCSKPCECGLWKLNWIRNCFHFMVTERGWSWLLEKANPSMYTQIFQVFPKLFSQGFCTQSPQSKNNISVFPAINNPCHLVKIHVSFHSIICITVKLSCSPNPHSSLVFSVMICEDAVSWWLCFNRYLVTHLMGADLNNIVKCQKLTDDHVQFLIYQILRGLKVRPLLLCRNCSV